MTIDLEAIRARCDAATPGPWQGIANPIDVFWEEDRPEDADFIAHAREDMPALIAEVERLRTALEAVEWVTGPYDPRVYGHYDVCAWCKGCRLYEGHADTCQRQLALGK